MTIRTRLTVWYASILLASVFLTAGVMYYELVIERQAASKAGQPKEPIEEEIAEIIFFSVVPGALLTVIGGWWILRKSLKPLEELSQATESLSIDTLNTPLPRSGNMDEIDHLSEVLNRKNVLLETAFRQVKEFTLHASHELKTPLTILHAEIETSLNDTTITPAQREAYASQLDEIQRLSKIVEGLTLLAKADAGQITLAQERVHLDQLVKDSFEDAQILAQSKKLTVELTACETVTINGDRHRLRQLLLNLTDNAIKYNEPNGRVSIALKQNLTTAELTISNTGKGISAENLPRVFDRFYRQSSTTDEAEGCGLGLSICQWIAQSHQGSIHVASEPGGSTIVRVTFARTFPV